MNKENVYQLVKEEMRQHGTQKWCYTDYFADEQGKAYFFSELDGDKNIDPNWTDEEVSEYIACKLMENDFFHTAEQTILKL